MTPFGWDATDIKIVSERSSAAGASAARVPPRPPGDRTGPRVAPVVAVPDAHRLPPRPVRGAPPGPDRQTARIRPRPSDPAVGAHLPVPRGDPCVGLRPVVARLAPRRLRSRDPSAPRRDLGPPERVLVSGVRMDLPRGPLQRGRLVRGPAPRPIRPVWRDRRGDPARRIRLDPRDPLVGCIPRVPAPRDPPAAPLRRTAVGAEHSHPAPARFQWNRHSCPAGAVASLHNP